MAIATREIDAHARFPFGENWRSFLEMVNEERVVSSMEALREMLGVDTLEGLTFLDAGSGSGLSSLAAHRLGASVTSFDLDPTSVSCTAELRARFAVGERWTVHEGSVLDRSFLSTLGQFDIVYSWGVLHHSGDMWTAFRNIEPLVTPNGRLFISVYNDQGRQSRYWRRIKRAYNQSGPIKRRALVIGVDLYLRSRALPYKLARVLRRAPRPPAAARPRGMDRRHDLIDWVGGYPFEVAKPEAVFDCFHERGFELERLRTCGGGLGCNQFVFRRVLTSTVTAGGRSIGSSR